MQTGMVPSPQPAPLTDTIDAGTLTVSMQCEKMGWTKEWSERVPLPEVTGLKGGLMANGPMAEASMMVGTSVPVPIPVEGAKISPWIKCDAGSKLPCLSDREHLLATHIWSAHYLASVVTEALKIATKEIFILAKERAAQAPATESRF